MLILATYFLLWRFMVLEVCPHLWLLIFLLLLLPERTDPEKVHWHSLPYAVIAINSLANHYIILRIRYSENHMGCGQGRLIRMIDAIENAPEQSLIVIEEPETALHQDAQHNLAIYFLEVCKRKRHQIIVTTHSPTIVDAMPMEARKKTERTSYGTTVENNPTIAEIVSDWTKIPVKRCSSPNMKVR